jgi:DnaJ-class molecular chaperone
LKLLILFYLLILQTTIKAAYRKIALQMHPDKCNNDICKGVLERAMKAYEVLGNSERRKLYDISATTHEPIHSEAMDLTTEDFEKMLHDSDDLWIVQIYAGQYYFVSVVY